MTETCGCPTPTGISRRRLLGAATAAAAMGVVGGAVGDLASARYAFAGTDYSGDVLVVLSLRGGFDGLSAVVPAARPVLHVGPAGHRRPDRLADPARRDLRPAPGARAAASRCGTPASWPPSTRSASPTRPARTSARCRRWSGRHPGPALRTGWLDRVSSAQGAGSAFATVGIGVESNQQALVGPAPALLTPGIDEFQLSSADSATERARWTKALAAMHAGARPDVAEPARLRAPRPRHRRGPARRVRRRCGYPDGDLGRSLRDVARLVKANVGLRVATVDFGDWDMHVGLGRVDDGWMARQLADLGQALAAFAADLGPDLSRVSLVTLSEFGRRVKENASGGLDHGHGNLMLLLGGGIVGGRMHGGWPGLAPGALLDGDLPATNDYRVVLAEVLERRCGVAASQVFPKLGSARLGLARPR